MPKSQYISPSDAFASGFLTFDKIPLCQYKKTLAQEKKLYTKADFLRIYRDMRIIREFETMLNEIKTKSAYNGILPGYQRLYLRFPPQSRRNSGQGTFLY